MLQKESGNIEVFFLREENNGLDCSLQYVGKDIAENYIDEDIVCELSLSQITKIVNNYCEKTIVINDEDFNYLVISITEITE